MSTASAGSEPSARGAWGERGLGTDPWSPVSGPCPSQRPAGSPPPVPRVPQPASGSAPPGPTLAFWKRKREGSRAGCRGQAVSRVLAAGRGRRVCPGCPLRPGSEKAAGSPRGCARAPPAAFRPPLPVPPAPKPLRWQLPGAQPLGPTAGLDPEGISPGPGLQHGASGPTGRAGPRGPVWPVSVKPLAQTPRVMSVAVHAGTQGLALGGAVDLGARPPLSGASLTCPWHLSGQP